MPRHGQEEFSGVVSQPDEAGNNHPGLGLSGGPGNQAQLLSLNTSARMVSHHYPMMIANHG
jgi:hypothetical protein